MLPRPSGTRGFRMLLASLALVSASASASAADGPRVVSRSEILDAMRHSQGYELTATANGARLQAEVLLRVIAEAMLEICPDALLLNYANPMSINCWATDLLGVDVVGLCHSVQGTSELLARELGQTTAVRAFGSRLITHAEANRGAALAEMWRLAGFWREMLAPL